MEKFALIQVCVDDRLNHDLLRSQIRDTLAERDTPCDHIFIVNEIAGNLGENFKNTVTLIERLGAQLELAVVLHHDDCRAAHMGLRRPLVETIAQMETFLADSDISCVLLSGQIHTSDNVITWETERIIQPSR
jgi:hypothetical protein